MSTFSPSFLHRILSSCSTESATLYAAASSAPMCASSAAASWTQSSGRFEVRENARSHPRQGQTRPRQIRGRTPRRRSQGARCVPPL
eukprot:IDg11316t1